MMTLILLLLYSSNARCYFSNARAKQIVFFSSKTYNWYVITYTCVMLLRHAQGEPELAYGEQVYITHTRIELICVPSLVCIPCIRRLASLSLLFSLLSVALTGTPGSISLALAGMLLLQPSLPPFLSAHQFLQHICGFDCIVHISCSLASICSLLPFQLHVSHFDYSDILITLEFLHLNFKTTDSDTNCFNNPKCHCINELMSNYCIVLICFSVL